MATEGKVGRWRFAGWALVAVLAVLVGVMSLRLLTLNPLMVDEAIRTNLLDHPVPFFTHTIVSAFALLIGVWQFLPATRRSRYHRLAGRLYVGCVAVGGVTGLIVAPTSDAGLGAGISFMILAVLWLATTAIGWSRARAGDFARHRVWMIRSYAMCAAAITLRLILPAGLMLGFSFTQSYLAAAWGCWIINLIIAEMLVRRLPVRGSLAPVTPRRMAASR